MKKLHFLLLLFITAPAFPYGKFVNPSTPQQVQGDFNDAFDEINSLKKNIKTTQGTLDGTTYSLFRASFGGGTFAISGQTTISVSTIKTIYLMRSGASVVFLEGRDGSNNYFEDLLMGSYGNLTINVISQKTIIGSPATRTYSSDGAGSLQLVMGSGVYAISAVGFDLSAR